METQSQKMIVILEKIIALLAVSDSKLCAGYHDYLKKILFRLNRPHDLNKMVEGDIMPIFGGMGSFNDISIYQDDKPVPELNRKFEKAADELFAVCQEVIAASKKTQ